jgi:hypothetical protein
MWRWIGVMCVSGCVLMGSAAAQALYQPTQEPTTTAETTDWYSNRSPIVHAGNTYYPAGVPVFFDGNVMVRTGWYRRVPLYADTTVEPFSIVLVPIGGKRLQPYERRREGDVVGTSGSRTPSFPTGEAGTGTTGTAPPTGIMAPAPPVGPNPDAFQPPAPVGAVVPNANTPRSNVIALPAPPAKGPEPPIRMAPTRVTRPQPQYSRSGLGTGVVSINYEGVRWKLAGGAVPFEVERFVQVGTYRGFPVYALRQAAKQPQRIFIVSTSGGLVTPYARIP